MKEAWETVPVPGWAGLGWTGLGRGNNDGSNLPQVYHGVLFSTLEHWKAGWTVALVAALTPAL